MKIKSLYIGNYKKFNNFKVEFYITNENKLLYSIFEEMNITALIGENGSGKTTILSFISIVFRYLQRKQSEIPSDFILTYQINDTFVEISKVNEDVFISINEEPKLLLLEYDLKKGYSRRVSQERIKLKDTTYDNIKCYLPSIVVVSSFDIDYPNGYAWNYKGDRLLEISSGYEFQKESSLGLNISLGIFIFLRTFYASDNYFVDLFNSLGLNLSSKICAYYDHKHYDKYYDIDDDKYYEMLSKIINILKKHNISNFENIGNSILNGSYFDKYFSRDDIDLSAPYESFDLMNYLKTKSYHSEVLEILIQANLFYINDFYLKKGTFEYSMSKMSTGEKMFLCRIFFILSNIKNNSIVIIEEPEVHLNYSWIKQIISVFILLFKDYDSHFFISSHNYSFINNLMSEQILIMGDDAATSPKFNTLLCNNEELNYYVFRKSNVKNYIENYIQEILVENKVPEMKELFENLGESYTKLKLFKKLIELGEIHVEN